MKRLEELLLLILDRAKKADLKDLSSFQMFKIPYLIQVLSIRYVGKPFIPNATFIREERGPISIDIYDAIESLTRQGYIGHDITKKNNYPYKRDGHKLLKKLPKLDFTEGEVVFLDNILSDLLPLSQTKLKEYTYSTEPMKEVLKNEKGHIKKGVVIDFSSVSVDPDVVDAYSESI